jgi:hypothetical protein
MLPFNEFARRPRLMGRQRICFVLIYMGFKAGGHRLARKRGLPLCDKAVMESCLQGIEGYSCDRETWVLHGPFMGTDSKYQ